jgi:hypothetical protein
LPNGRRVFLEFCKRLRITLILMVGERSGLVFMVASDVLSVSNNGQSLNK